MTVNEMIKELQAIADAGHGDAIVVNQIIGDWGGDEVAWCEWSKGYEHGEAGQVNLYE